MTSPDVPIESANLCSLFVNDAGQLGELLSECRQLSLLLRDSSLVPLHVLLLGLTQLSCSTSHQYHTHGQSVSCHGMCTIQNSTAEFALKCFIGDVA